MTDLSEIKKILKNFCNTRPSSGFEVEYLQKASEILELYAEAICMIEHGNDKELRTLLEEVKNLAANDD